MHYSRRQFLARSATTAAGFVGLRSAMGQPNGAAATCSEWTGYGPLVPDPHGLIDLPSGFRYSIIARSGDEMDDGLVLPGRADGMATFPGPNGLTILITNHELDPGRDGPWGQHGELLRRVRREQVYDWGFGRTPGCGGTTTTVFDTKSQRVVRRFLSLAGTYRNCAGGPTPWNSWISCEETVQRVGWNERRTYQAERNHGYNFEVPATTVPGLVDPIPLREMGRFNHEAVALHPATGIVYETEDRDDGLIYRFLPRTPGKLADGGRLQALAVVGQPQCDLRNWSAETIPVGERFPVQWIDVQGVDVENDDLRYRGFEKGAARFARGEGMWEGDDIYFACTNGGSKRLGQLWRYIPSSAEGEIGEKSAPASLELFIEPNDSRLVESADNLTTTSFGDLLVCEDRQGDVVRLVGVTPQGNLYTFAHNHAHTEFAGVTFSPDGTTLFVNLQDRGETVAIRGPWKVRRG